MPDQPTTPEPQKPEPRESEPRATEPVDAADQETVSLDPATIEAVARARAPEADAASGEAAAAPPAAAASPDAAPEAAEVADAAGSAGRDESAGPATGATSAADRGGVARSAAADPATPAADTSAVPAAASAPTDWRQQIRDLLRPRMNAAGVVIALLVGLLGFALIAQVHSNSSTSTLSNDRPDDLVRILSDLDSRKDRLNAEILNLQETQRQLSSGAQSKQAALNAATERADELGILAGTLPAQGPGVVVQLQPTSKPILTSDVLNTVEELRGAGAEAMQISGQNGATVRVIASTWFVQANGGISASGTLLTGTMTITAIGGAQTMQTALNIPGGVVDQVQQDGGTVLVQAPGTVRVTALVPPSTLKYAHPVP